MRRILGENKGILHMQKSKKYHDQAINNHIMRKIDNEQKYEQVSRCEPTEDTDESRQERERIKD